VAVSGSYVYVADYGSGLQVVDVSNPTSPAIVGSVDTPGEAWSVAVSARYVYVAGYDLGVQVVDVSNPVSPQVVGSVNIPNHAYDVAASGSYAYIADAGSGLQIVDVSNPSSPAIVGGVGAGFAWGVAVSESYAYVAGGSSGLLVVPAQCEKPTPVLLSGFAATVRGRSVELTWFTSFEHLHDGFNTYRSRLLTSEYARLNDQLVRGRSPYSYLDRSVEPSTTYFYRIGALDSRGYEVLHPPTSVTTPAYGLQTALSFARPNPFRKETTLDFALAGPAKVKLAVYDLAGRLVRVLACEELPEGDHDASWNGRDDAGHWVARGEYFVKFTADDFTQTRKVVFLGQK
jgi:hypothetical protein